MVKALNTLSVEPVMVMILSGQEPSEMLTRALLCGGQTGWRGEGHTGVLNRLISISTWFSFELGKGLSGQGYVVWDRK